MSATTYDIKCSNGTNEAWCFALYQDFPQSAGLSSVAWQMLPLPKAGAVPSTGNISWEMQYGVAILDFDQVNGVFTGSQIVNADLGTSFEVVKDPTVPTPTIQKTSTPAPSGQINFKNNTQTTLKMGFCLNDKVIAVNPDGVEAGNTMQYQVHPTYYMACYRNIQQGQLITSDQALGPVTVKFPSGSTKATVKAGVENGQNKLEDPKYTFPL